MPFPLNTYFRGFALLGFPLCFAPMADAQAAGAAPPMIMPPNTMAQQPIGSTTSKLPDPAGVQAFEAHVIQASNLFQLSRQKPTTLEAEVMAKLRTGSYVTDAAIMAMVGAWSVYESPGLHYAGQKDAQNHLFPGTRRVINALMPFSYGRPDLQAKLYQALGTVADLDHDPATSEQAYGKALAIQTPFYEEAWLRYDASCVRRGDLLLQLGKVKAAAQLYIYVLHDDSYYLLDDDIKKQALTTVAIQAGQGLINCRRGDLKLLQRTFFSPAISHTLDPIRDKAILDAQGGTANLTKPTMQAK